MLEPIGATGIAALRRYSAPLGKAAYAGREQTFIKHFFLRRYLQALAFKLLQAQPGRPFLYIDGFSGPWRSGDETREDTSFSIALNVLSDVVEKLRAKGSNPTARAIFVERDREACDELRTAVDSFGLVQSQVFHGRFEDQLDSILAGVGDAFAFLFVDPRGWTGMPLPRLHPLLQGRRREVLVNLMAYAINRHVGDERETIRGSFDTLFGETTWWDEYVALKAEIGDGKAAFRALYLRRLQAAGGYRYVTTTRVRWPGKNTTYFYLAYGTNDPAGVFVFRDTERRCIDEQEEIAHAALLEKSAQRSGTRDLFAAMENANEVAFKADRARALVDLGAEFERWLAQGTPLARDELFADLMQRPLIAKADCQALLRRAEQAGRLATREITGRANPMVLPRSRG